MGESAESLLLARLAARVNALPALTLVGRAVPEILAVGCSLRDPRCVHLGRRFSCSVIVRPPSQHSHPEARSSRACSLRSRPRPRGGRPARVAQRPTGHVKHSLVSTNPPCLPRSALTALIRRWRWEAMGPTSIGVHLTSALRGTSVTDFQRTQGHEECRCHDPELTGRNEHLPSRCHSGHGEGRRPRPQRKR